MEKENWKDFGELKEYLVSNVGNIKLKTNKIIHKVDKCEHVKGLDTHFLIYYNEKIISSRTDKSIEEWKIIRGNEEYLISNYGNALSTKTNKLLELNSLRSGYKSIHINGKALKIHRIVATEFIHNDDPTKNVVNHIDGDKLNNHVSNLEWTTLGDNTKHAYTIGKNRYTTRSIKQFDKEGNLIKQFESIKQANEETGIDCGSIAHTCKGKVNTAGGFIWKFADNNPNEYHEEAVDLSDFIVTKGFPNYQISNDGRIYTTRFRKFKKAQTNADGYKIISLCNDNFRKTFLVHRLVAENFIPKIEGKDLVNHIDGNKINNHVTNLEWVTNGENVKHGYQMKKERIKQQSEKQKKGGEGKDIKIVVKRKNQIDNTKSKTLSS